MKEFVLNENQSGYQLNKVLHKILSEAPTSFIYKMLRKKNITLNGRKAAGDEITQPGDVVRFFLSDETFEKFSKSEPLNADLPQKHNVQSDFLHVIYQDEDVLLFDKPQGLLSQKAEPRDLCANDFVLEYAKMKGLWNPDDPIFRPSIVNRLDRNTEGIMAAGLSANGLRVLNEMFKERTLSKFYRTITVGKAPEEAHLLNFIHKDEARNMVKVYEKPGNDRVKIETEYQRLRYDSQKDLSLLEVHLITGKSHQIRAQLSFCGCPLLGDNKYGDRRRNAEYRMSMQCLQSYRIEFPECPLKGISGKSFEIGVPAHWPEIGES